MLDLGERMNRMNKKRAPWRTIAIISLIIAIAAAVAMHFPISRNGRLLCQFIQLLNCGVYIIYALKS